MTQEAFSFEVPAKPTVKGKPSKAAPKPAWPSELLEQTQAVRSAVDALRNAGAVITPDAVAERFTRAPRARVQEILQQSHHLRDAHVT